MTVKAFVLIRRDLSPYHHRDEVATVLAVKENCFHLEYVSPEYKFMEVCYHRSVAHCVQIITEKDIEVVI